MLNKQYHCAYVISLGRLVRLAQSDPFNTRRGLFDPQHPLSISASLPPEKGNGMRGVKCGENPTRFFW